MRGNLATPFYAPGVVPERFDSTFLRDELGRLSAALQALAAGHLSMTYVAPTKPREGDLRLADGTEWDPGSGAGVYCYYAGTWNRLG